MCVVHRCGLAWRRRGPVAALAVVGALAGRPDLGAAQDSVGTLIGVVTALDGGERLPFSTVAIDPPGRAVFTDSAGAFRISGLAPGTYRLLIRELGYAPQDTSVDIAAGPPGAPIPFALARVPMPLPPVAVRVRPDCRVPGMPDSSVSPELAALAAQMRANAERAHLLATKYPYEYDVQAWLTGRQPSSAFGWGDEIDTLTFESWVNRPYRVAHVVDTKFVGRRPRGRYLGPYVYLPDLADLADSSFQAWHCFTFGGTTVAGDQTVVRIDFAPARALHDTDVAGSVYLDAARMVVRRASFWLTRPERLLPAVHSYRVDVWYREVLPLVAIEDSVHVVQTWGSVVTGGEHTSTEAQRVIGYRLHVPAGTE
jgi:hypothetical protein